jgi:hypothetical protein
LFYLSVLNDSGVGPWLAKAVSLNHDLLIRFYPSFGGLSASFPT